MSAPPIWCAVVDRQKNPIGNIFEIMVPSDTYVAELKDMVKKEMAPALANVDASTLNVWKLRNPPDVTNLRDGLEAFLGEIRLDEASLLCVFDEISDFDWPKGVLHIIVQLPGPVVSTKDNLQNIESDEYPRELVIKLPKSTPWAYVQPEHLGFNHIRHAQWSPRLQELKKRLVRKRYVDEQNLPTLHTSVWKLPHNLSNKYFEMDMPAKTPPSERVTENELAHYINILVGSELSKLHVFAKKKECHIYALLLNFLEAQTSISSGCPFGTAIPFHLVVETKLPGNRDLNLMYTPRPDFHVGMRGFPHILLGIVSQENESDRYHMLLQAACLARFGNRISTSKEPVVIMAIYIDQFFGASQYLVSACTEVEVEYVHNRFQLQDRKAAFELIFQLYNFVSLAKADNGKFKHLASDLARAERLVVNKGYQALTTTVPTELKLGATDKPSLSETNSSVQEGSFDDPSIQENLAAAGYTLKQIPRMKGLKLLTPLKPTMHEATSRMGVPVILKIISDSNERKFLQHLGAIKAQSNHTIPLLAVIELSIGKTIIVLPRELPLDKALRSCRRPNDVMTLCTQFIQGVAFLHDHKVAHCDLKPGNVVVDINEESKTSPRLFIIDFGIAEFVESEETLVEGWRGTREWVAPELGSRNGPLQKYSPILADRWACGLMIDYFEGYMHAYPEEQKELLMAFARRLLDMNPRARPSLDQLPATDSARKRILQGDEDGDEPEQKRVR